MEKESLLVFDVESDGFLEEATVVHVISAKAYPDGKLVSFYGDTLTDFFEYAKQFDVLCGHNAIDFDLPLLKKLHGFEWEWPRRVVDTLVMSRLQRPDRQLPPHCLDKSVGPHSVEAWGYRLGRIKPGHEDWSVFSAEMLHRNREDVEIQCRILSTLIEEGQGEGWENAHKLNARLFSLLKKQELCGWTFDVKAAQKGIETLDRYMAMIDKAVGPRLPIISERLEKKDKEDGYSYVKKPFKQNGDKAKRVYEYMGDDVDQVWGAFSRVSFRRVDITARAETVSYLLARGWEPLEWNYNKLTGEKTSPKLSKREEFIGVETKEGKLIAKRVICRARRGILQGWLASVRPDGRIPTPTNGMATTGRIKHAVVVNVPSPSTKSFFAKHMRAVFIPQAGWVMIGCDSAGNQIRQLAARMQDDEFTKAVLFGRSDDGTDLHSLNQRRASLETRTLAKNFFYGLLFGAGPPKLARTCNKTVDQMRSLKEQYLNEMPKLKALLQELSKQWKSTAVKKWENGRSVYKNGWIRGLDGRRIYVESEHMLLVYMLQSDEAIQMAAAYCRLHDTASKAGYVLGRDWNMLVWYHDEFQMESKPEIAQALGKLAEDAIAWAGKFYKIACPHEGQAKIGNNWKETH